MTHEDLALLDTLRALQGYLLQILIRSFYGCLISNRQTDRRKNEVQHLIWSPEKDCNIKSLPCSTAAVLSLCM